MFIDYITLLLTNMAAGLLVLAWFYARGLGKDDLRPWAAPFAATGLVATLCGLHMVFTWPVIGPYNSFFGEMSVLLGAVYLAAALALGLGWTLRPLSIYAFIAGLAAILVGARIIHLNLTAVPLLSGIGFILTGAGGLLLGFVVCVRQSVAVRVFAALVVLAASGIWAVTAGMAYWVHADAFKNYKPAAVAPAPPALTQPARQ
ncbi:MAG: DUF981 domain-containing protein [Planctomycetaceae bacterium]|nr:DUF981 domain-containing protein [Planctomycetaceae bacterium]